MKVRSSWLQPGPSIEHLPQLHVHLVPVHKTITYSALLSALNSRNASAAPAALLAASSSLSCRPLLPVIAVNTTVYHDNVVFFLQTSCAAAL
jgi:hypothetical protein